MNICFSIFFLKFVFVNPLNPIPTGLGHVTLIYGLIPPMAGRNRVKPNFVLSLTDES